MTEGRRAIDWFAAAVAFLLPVAYSQPMTARFFTPKAAVLLLTVPVGLVMAVHLVRTATAARPAAIAGLAFVGIAALSTAFSDNRHLAFFGRYGAGTGWLYVAALVGCWAIGRALSPRGQTMVTAGLAAAVVVNALVAVLQHFTDLSEFGLALQFRRGTALMGNPVHASTLFTGGALLAGAAARTNLRWLAIAVVAAIGVQASGSRLALAVVVVGAGWWVARHRDRRALVVAATLAAGLGLGAVIVATSSGVTSSTRLAEGVVESSTTARLHAWRATASAVLDHPFVGNGPGRLLTALEPHRPLALVRLNGDSRFEDAHNAVIEYAVTTGVPGVLALLALVVLAAIDARGPLLAFAAGIAALLLVQPLHPATAPLALLALGAAATRVDRPPLAIPWRAGVAVGTLAAAAGSVSLLTGDAALHEARLDYKAQAFRDAGRFLPRWPEVPRGESFVWVFYAEADDEPELYDRAVAARREAERRDPADPRTHGDLAAILLKVGDLDGAERELHEALERSPRFIFPRLLLTQVAIARGDFDEARRVLDEAAELRGTETRDMHELHDAIDDAERGTATSSSTTTSTTTTTAPEA